MNKPKIKLTVEYVPDRERPRGWGKRTKAEIEKAKNDSLELFLKQSQNLPGSKFKSK